MFDGTSSNIEMFDGTPSNTKMFRQGKIVVCGFAVGVVLNLFSPGGRYFGGLINYYQSQTRMTKSHNHNTFGLCEGLHISTNDIGEKFLNISKNNIGEF